MGADGFGANHLDCVGKVAMNILSFLVQISLGFFMLFLFVQGFGEEEAAWSALYLVLGIVNLIFAIDAVGPR